MVAFEGKRMELHIDNEPAVTAGPFGKWHDGQAVFWLGKELLLGDLLLPYMDT